MVEVAKGGQVQTLMISNLTAKCSKLSQEMTTLTARAKIVLATCHECKATTACLSQDHRLLRRIYKGVQAHRKG